MACKIVVQLADTAVEEVNSIADLNHKAHTLHRVLVGCINDLLPTLVAKPLTKDSKFVKHIGITIQGEVTNED